MTHARLSPSGAKRWMNCSGSPDLIAKLTAEGKIKHRTTSFHAAKGTVEHEIGEICLRDNKSPTDFIGKTMGSDGFEFEVNHEMAASVEIYVNYVLDRKVECDRELKIETACSLKALGVDGLDGGTSDAVLIDRTNETIEVVDYKGGAGVKVYAEENVQAMQYGLGALLDIDKHEMQRGGEFNAGNWTVIVTIVQPKADWDHPIDTWEINGRELYDWCEDTLIPDAEACVPGAPLTPGDDQCRFCDVKGACPALHQLTQETAMVDFDVVDDVQFPNVESMTAEQKAQVLKHAGKITKFLAAVKAQVLNELGQSSDEYRGMYKLVRGRGKRVLSEDARDPDFSPLLEIVDHSDVFEPVTTKSLTYIENAVKLKFQESGIKAPAKKAKELVSEHCNKEEGNVTIAPWSDKRPELPPSSVSDFLDNDDGEFEE